MRIHAACWLFGSTDTPTCRNQAINLWVSYIVRFGGRDFRSLIKYDSFGNFNHFPYSSRDCIAWVIKSGNFLIGMRKLPVIGQKLSACYTTIFFPNGCILLAGNVGSGTFMRWDYPRVTSDYCMFA